MLHRSVDTARGGPFVRAAVDTCSIIAQVSGGGGLSWGRVSCASGPDINHNKSEGGRTPAEKSARPEWTLVVGE